MDYIAYYRVSTQRQKLSGLGLDAQREAVSAYARNGNLVAEFCEIESGKRWENRPQLAAALTLCRKRHAVLLIARLDRLARNVAFISTLMESATEFIACDMPHANRLTIHILAAVAEHEREMISARTRDALAAARANGTILGNPRLAEARERARAAFAARRPHTGVIGLIRAWRDDGASYREIARRLNAIGSPAPRAGRWHPTSVRTQLIRAA